MTPEWITAISTAVYVAATIWIVVSNAKIAKSTRIEVEELQRQFQEQNRPRVFAQIEDVRHGLTCLSIENTGSLPAEQTHVEVNEETFEALAGTEFQDELAKLTNSAIYLSPSQKLYCCLGGPDSFERLRNHPLLINVTYGQGDREYSDHFEIDLNGYGWALLYDSPLGDISTYVQRISESLDTIKSRIT